MKGGEVLLILKGTKTVDLSKDELTEIIGQFDRVHIDLGTGDGRNIYKLAINDQNTFYIGIDPVKENLFDISKKITQIAITSWTPRGKNLGHGWSRRIYP